MNDLNITVVEDDSVRRKIEKTSQMLNRKFNKKQKKVNENKLLKQKTKTQKVFAIITDCLCAVMVIFGMIFCVASLNCRIQNIVPSFAGYSSCRVASGSMIKSGFNVGDNVIVRSVNAKTLRGATFDADGNVAKDENGNAMFGDVIAFYADSSDQSGISSFVKVDKFSENLEYTYSFSEFFGLRNEQMVKQAKSGSKIFFHHIVRVFEDKDGVRWFETQGSSNSYTDQTLVENADGTYSYLNCGYISEKMVIGVYDDSSSAKSVSFLLSAISSNWKTLAVVLVPLMFLAILLIFECGNDVRLAVIECDVVDGKRKLTDEVCVKNGIGYNLSKKDKLKVLSHTPPDEINETIALMWRDGSAPTAIKKYYLRKCLALRPMIEKNNLMEKCKQMKYQGLTDTQIAKFYLSESKKIAKQEQRTHNLLKKLRKHNSAKSKEKQAG